MIHVHELFCLLFISAYQLLPSLTIRWWNIMGVERWAYKFWGWQTHRNQTRAIVISGVARVREHSIDGHIHIVKVLFSYSRFLFDRATYCTPLIFQRFCANPKSGTARIGWPAPVPPTWLRQWLYYRRHSSSSTTCLSVEKERGKCIGSIP